ncbi:MAG: hypothetical protein JWO91_2598 [Acidobacteriaceae bacterium]|nr:hypothetical protein [Acidobacteriaceae bacterium]
MIPSQALDIIGILEPTNYIDRSSWDVGPPRHENWTPVQCHFYPEILVTHRGTYVCVLGSRECHPFFFPVCIVADDADPAGISFARHVQRSRAIAAGFIAHRPGICDSQSERTRWRKAPRPNILHRDASHNLHRNLYAFGSGLEPDLALSREPLLLRQPMHFAGFSIRLRNPRFAFRRAYSRKRCLAAIPDVRSCHVYHSARRIYRHEDLRDSRQHWHLLPNLLAIAQRKGAAAGCIARSGNHGTSVRDPQIHLHSRPAASELPGSLRAICTVSKPDVLGISVRITAAHRREFVSAAAQP